MEPVKKLYNRYRKGSCYVRLSTLERAAKHGHKIVRVCKKNGEDFQGEYDAHENPRMVHLDNTLDHCPTKKERELNTVKVLEKVFGSNKP